MERRVAREFRHKVGERGRGTRGRPGSLRHGLWAELPPRGLEGGEAAGWGAAAGAVRAWRLPVCQGERRGRGGDRGAGRGAWRCRPNGAEERVAANCERAIVKLKALEKAGTFPRA